MFVHPHFEFNERKIDLNLRVIHVMIKLECCYEIVCGNCEIKNNAIIVGICFW